MKNMNNRLLVIILVVAIIIVAIMGFFLIDTRKDLKTVQNDLKTLRSDLGLDLEEISDEEMYEEDYDILDEYLAVSDTFLSLYGLADNGAAILCNYEADNVYGLGFYTDSTEMVETLETTDQVLNVNGTELELFKTKIEYEDYKYNLLDYVSEDIFNQYFTEYQKDVDGILYTTNHSFGAESFAVESIEEDADGSGKYTVTYNHTIGDDAPVQKTMKVTFEENEYGMNVISSVEF